MESSDQPGCIIHSSPAHALLPSLPQLLYKFAVRPSSLPTGTRFSSLMAKDVCIDTTPQSCTAVRGQSCPAGGQRNDKVNEGGPGLGHASMSDYWMEKRGEEI